MKKVVLGIGIPGSGKTTILKPFAQDNGYVYVSPDEIRQEFSGHASNHSRNQEVWEEAYRRTAEALQHEQTVVFDATFAKDFERKAFIRFAREQGAHKVQGVFDDIPFEVANERNKARDRVVPEYAVERMDQMLRQNPPLIEDGFDSIFHIDEIQKLTEAEMKTESGVIDREFKQRLH